jgi:hypothetical protein
MSQVRLNWGAVHEALELVRKLKTAGVCMCETLGAPRWARRLDTVEEALVGLLRDSGFSAGVYGAWERWGRGFRRLGVGEVRADDGSAIWTRPPE